MKRKNYIFSLASALLMGTMALSLTACSSEDNIVNNIQQPAQGEVHTYTVSIPATFSDNAGTRAVEFDNSSTPAITTKFVEDEKVYVFNNNPSTPQLLGGYLLVKNVSTDKKSCELQGQVTGTISPDDEVALLYNLNNINSPVYSVTDFYYEYNDQKGTAASCVDGATATMKVKEIGDASNNYKMTFYAPGDADKTEAKALFANVQSMFRFQFADDTAPTTPIKVKTLNIQSKNVQLARRYYLPVGSTYPYWSVSDGIDVTPTTATDDYLYVALCFNANGQSNNELYFSVTDDAGYAYKGSKSGPTGGFQNGKYYYNTAPIALAKLSAPTITWTNPSTPVAANTSFIYAFPVGADEDPDYDITVSGTCNGYAFDISSTGNKGTIRLNSLNATWKNADPTTPFISVTNGDVLFELTGANSITCNTNYAIHDGNNLKLSCTGASATLTVTASSSDFCGILGDSNYEQSQVGGAYNYYPTTTELDVTPQLAAPGYTVTRSARTDNSDGTYTWTYTVAPSTDLATPLTLEATANGNIMVYPKITMSYSVDGGTPVEISANTTIGVTAGQKVSFYSTNSALVKVEGGTRRCTSIRPVIPCYVYGNVMSLIDDSGTGFANDKTISADLALCGLFNINGNTNPNLINHPTKRILLPATTLADNCYENMFYGCTGLTVAPDLPATELKSQCYKYMFYGCTNLTTAPDLPAPTLVDGCYWGMFSGCTKLNYVKCLATNVSAQFCLDNWLEGVSATGTFVKASSGADWAVAGSNGIPTAWTVTSE